MKVRFYFGVYQFYWSDSSTSCSVQNGVYFRHSGLFGSHINEISTKLQYHTKNYLLYFVTERERERIEEKKQRVSIKKMATTVTTGKVEETPKLMEVPTTAASPQLDVSDAKELKIEVHATAVHHEKLEPIVAHAQSHELHHEGASVRHCVEEVV